ncbi:MAG: hypothetical protein JXB05_20490 [Myxococcaceae bacterium]|nr:hypothetical protein [Myxococcaceae bacterium]
MPCSLADPPVGVTSMDFVASSHYDNPLAAAAAQAPWLPMNPPPAPPPLGPDTPHRAPTPEPLRGPVRWLLEAGAWALLGVALVDLFFRFSDGSLDAAALFTADNLYLPALYQDLFEAEGRWAGWRLTPAPYFFPDMALYFLLDALIDPFVHAALAYGVVQLVLLVLALRYLVRTVSPPGTGALGHLLAVVVVDALLLGYAAGHFPFMRYALLNAFHFSVVLLAVVALALALRTYQGGSRGAPWLLGGVCFLASASDSLFVVAFTAPVGIGFVLLAWLQRPARWRRLGLMLGVLSVSTLLGFWAVRWLTPRRPNAGFTRLRLGQAWESLRQLGAAVGEQFQARPVVMGVWASLVLGAVAVAVTQRRRWTAPDSPWSGLYTVCLYTVLMVGANASAVVLTGLFTDPESFRYLVLPLVLPFLAGAFVGARVPRERWQRRLGAGALGLAVVAWGAFILRSPWHTQGPRLSGFYPPLVECLDQNQARRGLGRGVSDYWNAKLVSMFSRTGLRVNQLNPKGQAHHWINNLDWYLDERGPRPDYNFLIPRGMDTAAFERQYGPPRETFRCGEVEIHVYGEGFDAALRAALARQLNLPNPRSPEPPSPQEPGPPR